MNERYSWAGGEELLHLSPGTNGDSIIAVLPPFEEANRTHALLATILRDLNARGFTTALPDLPGQGDSLVLTSEARLADWRQAFAAAAAMLPGRVHAVAVRGGALIDGDAVVASRWRLSAQSGAALGRELGRMTTTDGTIAGNMVAPDLLAALATAEPVTIGPLRSVRLASESLPADRTIEAAPLWRRAEPDNDPALAVVLADDIAAWTASHSVRPELVERPFEPTAKQKDGVSTDAARTGDRMRTAFACENATLVGTLDPSPGTTGLLIVSGGNEIRIGAHRGMALLAARVAAAGYPVLRYDRRGIGDASGANGGFDSSGPDLAAAVAHFRRVQPQVIRIVGFGNCDAATALALFGAAAGVDDLVLANPWTIERADDLPPPAAIRARYAAKLRNPRELWRLVSGGVNLRKLVRGVRRAGNRPAGGLAERLGNALRDDTTILTARGDNTAVAFRSALPTAAVIEHATDSHSFAGPGDADWLFARIVEKLR